MNKSEIYGTIFIIIMSFLFMFLGFFMGVVTTQQDFIDRGVAHYDSKTGQFEWTLQRK